MAATTSEQQVEGAERQQALRLVLAIVVTLVVAATALGAVLLTRDGGDGTQAEAVDPAAASGFSAATDEDGDAAAADSTAGDAATDTEAAAAAASPCPTAQDVPEPAATTYDTQPTVDLGDATTVTATITTTCGTIMVDLAADAAPTTVGNFVALAEDGYYDGVGFHRVIDGFMIQGGDPTGTGTGCLDEGCEQRLPGYTFADELTRAEEVVAASGGYPRGTLAMANAGPDTNGSQFFIVQASPGYPLPPNYTIFGEVTDGLEVVDRIAQSPVDGDLAVDPVLIRSVDVTR